MKSEELRIAKTESQFRDVNERIAETAERFGASEAELVCECSDPECGHRIEAPLADYEGVRADGAQFLVAPATRTRIRSAWPATAPATGSSRNSEESQPQPNGSTRVPTPSSRP